jgi:hypothetical protein
MQIYIDGTWTALPGGYQPPELFEVSPRFLPNEGGLLTILGVNFGSDACSDGQRVLLHMTPAPNDSDSFTFDPITLTWSPVSALARRLIECTPLDWAPTRIVCQAPPGTDAGVGVQVFVGGQAAQLQPSIAYAAPVVTAVTETEPIRTAGGSLVTLGGTGFPVPPWPVAVLVGDAPCIVINSSRLSSTSLMCVVPQGAGRAEVIVASASQVSNVTATLTYAPPAIINVSTPLARAVSGGFPVEVFGRVRIDAAVMPHGF